MKVVIILRIVEQLTGSTVNFVRFESIENTSLLKIVNPNNYYIGDRAQMLSLVVSGNKYQVLSTR